jgi:hypothetical protein
MLSAILGNRAFLTVRKSVAQDRCGSLLPLSGSHASLALIETVGHPAPVVHHGRKTPARPLAGPAPVSWQAMGVVTAAHRRRPVV